MTSTDDFAEFYAATFHAVCVSAYAHTGDAKRTQRIVNQAYRRAASHWSRLVREEDPVTWVQAAAVRRAKSPWHRVVRRFTRASVRLTTPSAGGPEAVTFLRVNDIRHAIRRRRMTGAAAATIAMVGLAVAGFAVRPIPQPESAATVIGLSTTPATPHGASTTPTAAPSATPHRSLSPSPPTLVPIPGNPGDCSGAASLVHIAGYSYDGWYTIALWERVPADCPAISVRIFWASYSIGDDRTGTLHRSATYHLSA